MCAECVRLFVCVAVTALRSIYELSLCVFVALLFCPFCPSSSSSSPTPPRPPLPSFSSTPCRPRRPPPHPPAPGCVYPAPRLGARHAIRRSPGTFSIFLFPGLLSFPLSPSSSFLRFSFYLLFVNSPHPCGPPRFHCTVAALPSAAAVLAPRRRRHRHIAVHLVHTPVPLAT